MLAALQSILDSITSAFAFLLNVIKGLVQLIQLLPRSLTFLQSAMTYLPSFVTAFILAGVAVSIIFLIVGRN